MDIPKNLADIDSTELPALRDQIRARVTELRGLDATAEVVEELEALAEVAVAVKTRIDTEKAEADAEKERTERLDKAGADLDAALAEDEPEDEPEEPTSEDEPVDEPSDEPSDEDEPVDEPSDADLVGAGAATTGKQRRSTAALSQHQDPSTKGKPSGGGKGGSAADDLIMRTTNFASRVESGKPLKTLAEAATVIANTAQFSRGTPGIVETLPILTGEKRMGGLEIGQDEVANFAVLDLIRQGALHEADFSALVASGPFCTPQTPLYDFFRLSVAQSPVERSLATVQAPRGGIRYIVPPDVTTAVNAGIGFTDESDIDPDDPDTWKPCTRVVCPTIADEFVTALSTCVTFGNLQYKTFPEQTAHFLEELAVAFASRKEVYFLDYIDGHSTPVTGVSTGFGAFRQHLYNLELAATGYRKRRGMPRGAKLRCYEPDWLLNVMKLDQALDAYEGLDRANVPDAAIEAMYASRGLEVIWYNDSATGRGQKWANAQVEGGINRFPTTTQTYLHSPGTFVKLDAGSLDVGLVRDTTTLRTNDVQLFMEEWLGMAMLGLESVRLVDSVFANGAATGPVEVFTG